MGLRYRLVQGSKQIKIAEPMIKAGQRHALNSVINSSRCGMCNDPVPVNRSACWVNHTTSPLLHLYSNLKCHAFSAGSSGDRPNDAIAENFHTAYFQQRESSLLSDNGHFEVCGGSLYQNLGL